MGTGSNKPANAAAIDRLALAVAKEPGSKAFIPLAEEYGKAAMWDEAAAVLEDGLKIYPNFITAMVILGRVYDQLNQPGKAVAILEEAVKLSSENLRAHRILAKIYAAQGQKDLSLQSCHVILAANPQDQEALSIRAMLGASLPHADADRERSDSQQVLCADRSSLETDVRLETAEGRLSDMVDSAGQGEVRSKGSTMLHEQKSVVVVRLEQWLATIRSRRFVSDVPTDRAA